MNNGSFSTGGQPQNPSFGTVVVTAALQLNAGAVFELFNTTDKTTNYERLRADWSGNVARIYTQFGGSASTRAIFFGVGATAGIVPNESLLGLQRGAAPFVSFNSNVSSVATAAFASAGGTVTASSGTQTAFAITPTINQSGTAGYIALDINPTETATGSGTRRLQRWAVGGTAVSYLTPLGGFVGALFTSTVGFSLGATLGGADISIVRDAADILALRRSTNAQTFRIYNTYTDASNYERLSVIAGATLNQIVSENAGTGAARSLRIGASAGADLIMRAGGADRWRVNSSGHFLAETDNSYDIGASGANRPRNIYVGGSLVAESRIYMGSATVAGLPSAASSQYGHMFVTDSSVAASGNFGAIVAGGGANIVPVYSDGTNWRIG